MRVGQRRRKREQREQREGRRLYTTSWSGMRYEHYEAGVAYEVLHLYIVYIVISSVFCS